MRNNELERVCEQQPNIFGANCCVCFTGGREKLLLMRVEVPENWEAKTHNRNSTTIIHQNCSVWFGVNVLAATFVFLVDVDQMKWETNDEKIIVYRMSLPPQSLRIYTHNGHKHTQWLFIYLPNLICLKQKRLLYFFYYIIRFRIILL